MTTPYSDLPDDALLELLSSEEDRLPRAAVDEILKRGTRLAPKLIAHVDDDELWDVADWAPVHAAFILAAMKGPGALDAVLRALERSSANEETSLMDVADSLLAAFGPDAVPALTAAFDAAGSYVKIWIDDALALIADAHPAARDAVHAQLRKAALEGRDKEAAACAAGNLLAFAGAGDRELLEILVDRNLIDAGAMEEALAGNADLGLPRPVDWLGFYSPEAIAQRQDELSELGHDHDGDDDADPGDALPDSPALDVLSRLEPRDAPAPIVNTGPKTGRNDPCPCGSGRKFKKCCEP
jgi:hypothetical protein